jgi:ATP phosphoribosyltransferase
LEGSDIQFRRENRLDIALVKNLPLALVFLPASDIPTFVGEGRVDLGITGQDQVAEHDAGVEASRRARSESGDSTPEEVPEEQGCQQLLPLEFGGCKLQVQVPVKGTYQTPKDLIGKNIGTSFVHLTEEYFARLEAEAGHKITTDGGKRKLKTKIIELSGSVEAACALGVADGIVDLVESGETMKAAGLKAIDTVVDTMAVLIKSKKPSNPELVELITKRIQGVISKLLAHTGWECG